MISTSQYMGRKYEKKLAKLLSRGINGSEYRNYLYNKWDEQSDFWCSYQGPIEEQEER
jgi:hypothetical protein